LATNVAVRDELWPLWVALWLLIYPPLGLDHRIVEWLNRHVAQTASGQLDLFHVPHLPAVASLDFPGGKLVVDDVCSGMRSSFALVGCSVLLAMGTRMRALPAACLIVAAVFWGYVWNVVCVICLAAVPLIVTQLELTVGWRQGVLEAAFFLAALGLVASTFALIRAVCVPLRIPVGERRPILRIWNWLVRARTARSTKTRTQSASGLSDSKAKSVGWTIAASSAWAIYLIIAGVQLTSRFGSSAASEQIESTRQMIRDQWIGENDV
jgi:hypothetical protein